MKKILLLLLLLAVAVATVLRFRYGGGESYVDLTSTPVFGDNVLEVVLEYPEPVGNVAVSASGRIFFTVHPESRPQGNRLLEFVNGAAVPFPDVALQDELFHSVLGIAIDRQNRLWTVDHGNHGLGSARLLAFDLDSNTLIHDQKFADDIAPAGSFLQDVQVSADGGTVIIADASFWRKQPALIVYNVGSASARRVLEKHESVLADNYVIHNHGTPMTFGGGLVAMRGGVDGIALGTEWLYYGALNGSFLYRVALSDLTNAAIPDAQLAARVERVAKKPLSDGLSMDSAGNVYGTDVEHGAIFRITRDGDLETLLRTDRLRWPDALSFGPDGWLYIADSALADVVLQTREHMKYRGPYKIFRIKPGFDGTPGQ